MLKGPGFEFKPRIDLLWQKGGWTAWLVTKPIPVLAFDVEGILCQALGWGRDKLGKSQWLKQALT